MITIYIIGIILTVIFSLLWGFYVCKEDISYNGFFMIILVSFVWFITIPYIIMFIIAYNWKNFNFDRPLFKREK